MVEKWKLLENSCFFRSPGLYLVHTAYTLYFSSSQNGKCPPWIKGQHLHSVLLPESSSLQHYQSSLLEVHSHQHMDLLYSSPPSQKCLLMSPTSHTSSQAEQEDKFMVSAQESIYTASISSRNRQVQVFCSKVHTFYFYFFTYKLLLSLLQSS